MRAAPADGDVVRLLRWEQYVDWRLADDALVPVHGLLDAEALRRLDDVTTEHDGALIPDRPDETTSTLIWVLVVDHEGDWPVTRWHDARLARLHLLDGAAGPLPEPDLVLRRWTRYIAVPETSTTPSTTDQKGSPA